MIIPVRRIVTGRDAEGRSFALAEGTATNTVDHPHWPGLGASMLWKSDSLPADNHGNHDVTEGPFRAMAIDSGINFIVAQFPPESDYDAMPPEQKLKAREMAQHIGEHAVAPGEEAVGMHATTTIDYDTVISGRLTLVLDSGEYELGPGDTVVVRGDRHTWRNYGSEPAQMAIVSVHAVGP